MATADVLFEVPGQKLRQDMLYELIFLKLVTANALCSRSFSCKGRSYFCHISHDTRKPAEPYVLRVSKEYAENQIRTDDPFITSEVLYRLSYFGL